ncbi:MAG: lipase family protein [Betaproteobacteria bacterium]|nr:MAG: lipase family protein [Betaproteobacteria bacterium]
MDMLGVLEVAIGMVLVYLILSLICTSLVEAVVGALKLRPNILKESVQRLVGNDLAADVYKDPEVTALFGPNDRLPSYMPTDVFARSILNIASSNEWRKSGGLPTVLRDRFVALANGKDAGSKSSKGEALEARKKLGRKLLELMDEAGGDIDLLKNKIELWFDRTGDRSKGWFKRSLNAWLIAIGFAIAALVNADTVLIFQRLSDDPALREAAVQIATEQIKPEDVATTSGEDDPPTLKAVREQVGTIAPFIGWSKEDPLVDGFGANWDTAFQFITKLFGLILTAFAISLGAPFWFDLLQKLVNVRRSVAADKATDLSKDARGKSRDDAETGDAPESDGAGAGTDEPAYSGPMAGFAPLAAKLNLNNAYWLAKAADLAYESDADKVRATIASWGLVGHVFESSDPNKKKLWGSINIRTVDTQGFIAADDNAILVCFRGTEPTTPADIVTDLSVRQVDAREYGEGKLHQGFRDASESVWDGVAAMLDELGNKQQPVFFAGHSLGGALAVLAASRYDNKVRRSNLAAQKAIKDADDGLEANPDDKDLIAKRQQAALALRGRVAGVYTIGQPRVGDRKFADDLNARLGDGHVRVINNRDIVPRVPLRAMDYDHSGTVLYIDEFGRLHRDPGLWLRLLDTVVVSRAEVKKAKEGVQDHNAKGYVDLLDKARKSKSALTRVALA